MAAPLVPVSLHDSRPLVACDDHPFTARLATCDGVTLYFNSFGAQIATGTLHGWSAFVVRLDDKTWVLACGKAFAWYCTLWPCYLPQGYLLNGKHFPEAPLELSTPPGLAAVKLADSMGSLTREEAAAVAAAAALHPPYAQFLRLCHGRLALLNLDTLFKVRDLWPPGGAVRWYTIEEGEEYRDSVALPFLTDPRLRSLFTVRHMHSRSFDYRKAKKDPGVVAAAAALEQDTACIQAVHGLLLRDIMEHNNFAAKQELVKSTARVAFHYLDTTSTFCSSLDAVVPPEAQWRTGMGTSVLHKSPAEEAALLQRLLGVMRADIECARDWATKQGVVDGATTPPPPVLNNANPDKDFGVFGDRWLPMWVREAWVPLPPYETVYRLPDVEKVLAKSTEFDDMEVLADFGLEPPPPPEGYAGVRTFGELKARATALKTNYEVVLNTRELEEKRKHSDNNAWKTAPQNAAVLHAYEVLGWKNKQPYDLGDFVQYCM